MWIRNQSKSGIFPIGCGGFYPTVCDNRVKLNSTNFANTFTIGVYASEERALKVLDEIQKYIECKEPELIILTKQFYEMPEI